VAAIIVSEQEMVEITSSAVAQEERLALLLGMQLVMAVEVEETVEV